MSNVVFVPPKGLTWPVKKTPVYSTIVHTPTSKRGELRSPLQSYPVWKFELIFNYLKGAEQVAASDAQYLVGLFGQMLGMYDSFLFVDPNDNSVTDQLFGVGDGTTTVFQLARTIGGMTDIVQNLIGTPTIKDNGSVVSPTISTKGVVTFGVAPISGHNLTWSGSFYYRLRFDQDDLGDLQEMMYQIWELQSLKLMSLIL